MTLRTVGVRLTAEVSQYMNSMRRAGGATREFIGETKKAAASGHLDHVADRAGAVGLALTGMAAYAIKSAADFDKSMSAVQAATHASGAEIDQLRKAALQAGKDTQYSATGAADAITELSKAGVSTADVLNGGLKGALSLAAAGQLDVGEAAETAASAMTQFGLSGDKIPHVADLLAAAAGKAQGSVHDMGYALNQSGLVASQFGLSIEDTTGALAEFANAGLIGSDAGTSFKTMLLAIANPSSTSAKLMQKLGVNFYDAQGKFIGLSGVAEVLRQRLGSLTEQQREQALGQLFGSDAIRAASIVYKDGAAGVEEWKNKVNEAGYAQKTAADLTNNLAGDIERLKGSVETLAIESGSGANGGLRVLVKGIEALVDGFGRLPGAVSSSLVVLAGIGGIALLGLAAFVKLRRGLVEAVEQLNAMGPAGEKAAAGLGRASSVAGKAAAVFATLEVVGVIAGQFGAAATNVDSLTNSLTNFSKTGKVAGALADVFGDDLSDLGKNAQAADAASHGFWGGLNDLSSTIPGVNSLVDTLNEHIYGLSFNQAKDNMGALDQALTNFMTTTNDARQASGLWNQVLEESGLGTQQLAALLPSAYKKVGELNTAAMQGKGAMGGMATATKGAAGATGDLKSALAIAQPAQNEYKTAADSTAGALRGEKDALISLSKQMMAEVDPVFGFITAQQGLKKAQDDATKAIKEHGRTSKEAKAATRELALAAIDLQGKAGALGGAFDGKLSPALKATLRAAGVTDAEMKILAGQFKETKKRADEYDGKYEAKTSAPGAKQAKADLDLAYTAANHFDGPYRANTSAPGAKQAKADLDHAYTAANKFAGPYRANISITGDKPVGQRLNRLAELQKALKEGKNISTSNKTNIGYAAGGWTGPGDTYDPAGIVHADEHVIRKSSRRRLEAAKPGALDHMNETGEWPGYAAGGRVGWPYRVNAAKTRVPPWSEVANAVTPDFGRWPSSPSAQRGDSGVWRSILRLVQGSGIPYDFGNAYRPGDPLWHGSGRAVDFMGYNQDRLAQFFLNRQSSVLELIHRSKNRDYGITRGHYNAMPHQWPLHKNHLHIAMKNGGTIDEPIMGVGASGRTYSFGENYQRETVTPHWQGTSSGGGGGTTIVVSPVFSGPVGSQMQLESWLATSIDNLRRKGRLR